MKIKNRFGFSILELMMAVGISGIAAVAVMQMTKDQVRVKRQVEIEFDVDTLVGVAQKILLNRAACTATFNGLPVNTAAPPANRTQLGSINNQNNTQMIANGGQFGDLNILNIEFVYRGDTGNIVNNGAAPVNKRIIGDVELQVQRRSLVIAQGSTASGGSITRKLPFPMELIVPIAGGAAVDCNLSAVDITEQARKSFCEMITNNKLNAYTAPAGGMPPICNLDLNMPAENPAGIAVDNSDGVVNPTPVGRRTRAVSIQSLEDQIALFSDPASPQQGDLYSTDPINGTTAYGLNLVPLAGGTVNQLILSDPANGLVLNDPISANNNAVINREYLANNLGNLLNCPVGTQVGFASNGTLECVNSCNNNQYSAGIRSSSGFSCNLIASGLPNNCANDEGFLRVASDGSVQYQCCSGAGTVTWSGTCDSSCMETATCSCGTCGGAALTRPCTTPCTPPATHHLYTCSSGSWTRGASCGTGPNDSLCSSGGTTNGTACCASTPAASTCTSAPVTCTAGAACTSDAQCGSGTCSGGGTTPARCSSFNFKECISNYKSASLIYTYSGKRFGVVSSNTYTRANSGTRNDEDCCIQEHGASSCRGGVRVTSTSFYIDTGLCAGVDQRVISEGNLLEYVPAAITPGTCSCPSVTPADLSITSSRPSPTLTGTVDIRNGEPGESIDLEIAISGDITEFSGITFGNISLDGILDSIHRSRSATVTLDSTGRFSSTYQFEFSPRGSGDTSPAKRIRTIITMTNRSSPKAMPARNSTRIDFRENVSGGGSSGGGDPCAGYASYDFCSTGGTLLCLGIPASGAGMSLPLACCNGPSRDGGDPTGAACK